MAKQFRPKLGKRGKPSHQQTKCLVVAGRCRELSKWIEDYFTGHSVSHPQREHFKELVEMFKKAERDG